MQVLFRKAAYLMVGAALVLSSCSEDDDQTTTPEPQGLTATLSADARFSVLVDALERTGLDATLSGNGIFTVFAPTDAAFGQALIDLGYTDLDALEAGLGTEGLRNVLRYHVLGTIRRSSDLQTGYSSTAATNADGDPLSFYLSTGNEVRINGSAVVREANIEASNGVAHVIDAVLLPLSIYDLVRLNPQYSSLNAALMAADGDLDAVLAGSGSFTLFAPNDEAFQNVIDATPGVSNLNDLVTALGTDGLSTVLLYHVTSGIILSSDLPGLSSNTVSTLALDGNGANFTFDLDLGMNTTRIIDGSPATDPASLTEVDIVGTNGAIHGINAVLLPE
ncbi:fasciclin domain-containing protein [Croceimicrobium sp.]|uniref:fasciclin domain-containing protein n=1 Tax=Croceimicrobium sp. TaxID=2828340 RepID=UPI003BA90077